MVKKKTATNKKTALKTGWNAGKSWKPVEIIRKPRFIPENGWLPQFETVFDFAVNDTRNGAISAVAGAGKTTALVEMAYRYVEAHPTHKVLAIAFNASIRKELQARMPLQTIQHTCHSFGYRSVMREWGGGKPIFDLQGSKGYVVKNLAEAVIGYEKEKEDDRDALCHAVSLCKTRLANTTEDVIKVMDD